MSLQIRKIHGFCHEVKSWKNLPISSKVYSCNFLIFDTNNECHRNSIIDMTFFVLS